jgi:hypothetical protein
MCLVLNMAKMANGGFSHGAIEEPDQLIKKPRTIVREEKKRCVGFPGHNKVKATFESHMAMVCENQTDGCLSYQNDTTKNPQTRWTRKGKGAPRPTRAPPWPESAPVPSDDNESYETEGLPPAYVFLHTPLPNTSFLRKIPCAIWILFQIC